MQRELSVKTALYKARHKRYKTWQKVVMVLASVVVFCTTYALILPAITMEKDVICGIEEHLHNEDCYQLPAVVEQVTLMCTQENLNLHQHEETCYNEFGEAVCGYADFVLHTHTAACRDQNGRLVCPLDEIREHIHDDDCYLKPHTHGEACYSPTQGALLCTFSDAEPHIHTEDCFTSVQKLNCDLPETEGHSHTETCYPRTDDLICGQEASEGHTHGADCLDENGGLVCTLPETEGHTHEDACYALASEPACGLEITEGHTHGVDCYITEQQPICPMEEGQTHAHEDACYEWIPQLTCEIPLPAEDTPPTLICEEPQRLAHTHDAACFDVDGRLMCGKVQLVEHIHGDTCFFIQQIQPETTVLACELQEHTHEALCYPAEDASGSLSAPGVPNLDIRYCGIASHEHVEACYDEYDLLMCTMTEHQHTWLCDLIPADPADVETAEEWEADLPELTGNIAADLIAVAQSQLGYEQSEVNYIIQNDEQLFYSRYAAWWDEAEPYAPWNAQFVGFCLEYAGIDFPLCGAPAEWYSDLAWYDGFLSAEEQPIPADLAFFDTDRDGEADRVGIITEVLTDSGEFAAILERRGMVQQVTYDLDDTDILGYARIPGNEPAVEPAARAENVQKIIEIIDALPAYEEVEAQMLAYEEAEAWDAYEHYLQFVSHEIRQAYAYYESFDVESQSLITNGQKLLDLEMFWSPLTYALTDTVDISAVNSFRWFDDAGNPNFGGALIVHDANGTTVEAASMGESEFEWWVAVVVEQQNGQYVVKSVNRNQGSKATTYASGNGFILLFHTGTLGTDVDVDVGDYAIMSSNFWKITKAYTGTVYGTVTFSDQPIASGIISDPVTTVPAASTSEFVELNVFDYYGTFNRPAGMMDINYRWKSVDTEYPGFQWNAGAYPYRYYSNAKTAYDSNYGWIANRNLVDCIDFGNSLITDYVIEEDLYVPDQGSANSSDTYYYNGTASTSKISVASSSAANGQINAIVYGNGLGNTDRPAGASSSFGLSIGNKLGSDGYPQLYNTAEYGTSLKYLFYDDPANNYPYADKKNSKNVDGLFQYNEQTGEYWFDSRENHAQFNDATDEFVLYDQIITPNFILYPFGNFLPFNDITDGEKATQVSQFNYQGGVRDYFENVMTRLYNVPNMNNSQIQLYRMLTSYKYNWINWADEEESHGRKWDTIKAADALNDYFNNSSEFSDEGWDFNTDPSLQSLMAELYNIDYDIPKNFFFGMEMKMNFMMPRNGITGPNNDQPMIFHFEGDDDVWVYIDDTLFLDLTGIHRHVGGEIDFVNGKVYYYAMDSYVDGAVSSTPFYTMTFADILKAHGGIAEADLGKYLKKDANGNYTTFLDYSTHKFNFYYMERGSGSSVCRINFNFPLLRKNAITVTKQNVPDNVNVELTGNPDYYFNIIKKDESDLFIAPGTSYKILNSGGMQIGTGTVDDYGIFTLKAGQSAVFEGIEENKGGYYVQELIKAQDNALYDGAVKINGQEVLGSGVVNWNKRSWFPAVDPITGINEIGPYGHRWYFYSSHYADASTNSTFYVEAQNGVITQKLGKLSITKKVEEYISTFAEKTYKFYVLLDGTMLPTGTQYKVGDATRTVSEPGIIEIAAGETATIENILSGTQFYIREEDESAKGYHVSYEQAGAEDVDNDGDSISGIIRVNTNVQVIITNSESGADVTIPLTKTMNVFDNNEHTYTFRVDQINGLTKDGTLDMTVLEENVKTVDVTVSDKPVEAKIQFSVKKVDIVDLPSTFYYCITEDPADGSLVNDTVYVFEVSVDEDTDSEKPLVASVTRMWKDGEEISGTDAPFVAAFTNTLIGSLTVSKKVEGIQDDNTPFTFTITMDASINGVYPALGGVYTDVAFTNGVATVVLKHGETVIIQNLPYGASWQVTEAAADGYTPTFTVTQGGTVQPAEGDSPTGTITTDGTVVAYTNTIGYELPETGGGAMGYRLMGSGMLLTLPILYATKRRYRGRRVNGG